MPGLADQATAVPGLTIDGTVRFRGVAGAGMAGVPIFASISAGTSQPGVQIATTDAEGRYSAALGYAPGFHRFAFWAAHSATSFEPQQYSFTWINSAGDGMERTLDFAGTPIVGQMVPHEYGSRAFPARPEGLWVSGERAFASGSVHEGGTTWRTVLSSFNVEDPHFVPEPVDLDVTAGGARRLHVRDGIAYLVASSGSTGYASLSLVDVGEASEPVVVGEMSSPQRSAFNDVRAGDGVAYVASSGGLLVADTSDRSNPRFVVASHLPGSGEAVDVVDGYAYLAVGESGMAIFDVSAPGAPVHVSSVDTPGHASDVAVVDGVAYIADGASGLRVFDVGDPSAPRELGSLDTPGEAVDVDVNLDHAYIADGVGGLRMVRVADPTMPHELASVEGIGYASAVRAVGSLVYVALLESASWDLDRLLFDGRLRVYGDSLGVPCPPPILPRRILVDQGSQSTTALSHTLGIRLAIDGEGPEPAVVTVRGGLKTVVERAELRESRPLTVSVPLVPGEVNHLAVDVKMEHLPGCAHRISTAHDERGDRLTILQGMQPTATRMPTATRTPTATPTTSATATGGDLPTPTSTVSATPVVTPQDSQRLLLPLLLIKRRIEITVPTKTPVTGPNPAAPDLMVSGMYISMEDTRCYYGQPLGTWISFRNGGGSPAGPFVVGVGVERRAFAPGLAESQSSRLWFSTRDVQVVGAVDTTDVVTESMEDNNSLERSLSVPTAPLPCPSRTPASVKPDLEVISMFVGMEDDRCDYGQPVGTWIRYANRGEGDTGPFLIAVNGRRRAIGQGLAAGVEGSTWFPGYLSSGEGETVGRLDASYLVAESAEDNNELRAQLPVPTAPAPCPTATRVPMP